ncbi:MAG TPA: porin, partial [Candidatus Edwardsbacteria bacterium]|nr:porin [Candidatus Edwardsbacteria bacterium]
MKRALVLLLLLAAAASAFAFDVKTDDKQPFPTFKVTGWVKVTYQDTVYHEQGAVCASGFDIKDAALVVGGDAWGNTSYRIYLQGNRKNKVTDKNDAFVSPTLAAYSPRLVEAYVDWKPSPLYSFRAGQYKKPMSQDNLVAATNMDFISSSQIVARFLDNNYDEGLMGYGKWQDLSYWLSLANGAPYNYKDKNWAKDVIGRATYLALPGLTVGGGFEYGTSDGAGMSLYRRRGGLEASYEWRKLFVRAEWMIGLDDKAVADSLSRTASKNVTDTIRCGWRDTLGAWHDTTYTRSRSV